jgi:hypothetical protein
MSGIRIFLLGLAAIRSIGTAQAAGPAPAFHDCPLTGVMPDYHAIAQPHLLNWDTETFQITEDGNDTEVKPQGAVCTQDYDETAGKTDGSALEIMENYKEALRQQGAEIKRDHVAGHLTKDGKEYWISVSAAGG